MRFKMFSAMLVVGVLSVFAVAAAAQHEEHHADQQTTQSQTQLGMMGQGQGTMGGGMMGMMNMIGQMTSHHQEMSDLMNKLMQSMTAIQNEKDPAALKQKLAEHSALLKQMHDQMMQQGNMMQSMSGMMMSNCPAAGNSTSPSTK
jgi:hypothetical protein